MLIGVRWAKGMVKVEAEPNDSVPKVIARISKQINVDEKYLALYQDFKYSTPLDYRNTLKDENVRNRDVLFLKVNTTLPDVPVAQMAMKSDIIDEFVPKGESIPTSIKLARKEFGNRAITGAFMEYLDSKIPNIVEQPESSCYAIRIGEEVLKRFRILALQSEFKIHKILLLFGKIDEYTGKSTVHCGMEPPQKYDAEKKQIELLDFNMEIPVKIAASFGMRCVGMVLSHEGNEKLPMPGYAVKLAANYQNLFGEYFTTIVYMPRPDGEIGAEAFQVSDAAMEIDEKGLFAEENNPNPSKVSFKSDVRLFGKKVRSADANLLLCAVRIRKRESRFPSHSFPSPNANPSIEDVKQHFRDNEFCPPWRQLFDFNLLVYLVNSKILSIDDAVSIGKSICKKEEVSERVLKKLAQFRG